VPNHQCATHGKSNRRIHHHENSGDLRCQGVHDQKFNHHEKLIRCRDEQGSKSVISVVFTGSAAVFPKRRTKFFPVPYPNVLNDFWVSLSIFSATEEDAALYGEIPSTTMIKR
jgi:hypothetical protein